jgi:hypothetical protein
MKAVNIPLLLGSTTAGVVGIPSSSPKDMLIMSPGIKPMPVMFTEVPAGPEGGSTKRKPPDVMVNIAEAESSGCV